MEFIQRTPIREQVYRQVLDSIVTGSVTPGTRVRDTEIAERLAVSRTPVRESLLRLEQEGFLENRVGRGFAVRPLELSEIKEVYPVLWTLECLALKLSGQPETAVLKKLEVLNGKIAGCGGDAIRLIDLDNTWHATLIEGCDNARLKNILANLKTVIRRYEYSYMRRIQLVDSSVQDHGQIVGALERGALTDAAATLEEHWRRSLEAMVQTIGS